MASFVGARLDGKAVRDDERRELFGAGRRVCKGGVGALFRVFENRFTGFRGEPVSRAKLQLRAIGLA